MKTVTPDWVLTTERLWLRPFAPTDAEGLTRIAGDRRIADTTISVPHPFTLEHGQSLIQRSRDGLRNGSRYAWAIVSSGDGALLGYAGLHDVDREHSQAELSFWVSAEAEGKGYVTEAAGSVVAAGFGRLELNRISAYHMVRNPGSGRVLQKLGFQQEGMLRQRVRKWGRFEDVLLWARLAQTG